MAEPTRWIELWETMHRRAFSVASSMPAEDLRAIQDAIDPLVATGASFDEAKATLLPVIRRIAANRKAGR